MDIIFFVYNGLLKVFLLVAVFSFGYKFSKRIELSGLNYLLVYILHFSLTIFSWLMSVRLNDDAIRYYTIAKEAYNWFTIAGVGAKFIPFVIYPLVNYLKFDFFSITLVFSSFSFIGFLYLHKVLNSFENSKKIKILGVKLLTLLLLLPGFHYWVCPLGKDSLIFLFQMLILNEIIKLKTNKFLIIILLCFIGLTRPYLIGFLALAVLLYFLLRKLNTKKKIFTFINSVILFSVGSIIVKYYFKIDLVEEIYTYYKDLSWYAERKIDKGSYIIPNKHSLLEKIWYHLTSPLFYDANSILQFMLSFENLILLIILIKFFRMFSLKKIYKNQYTGIILMYSVVFIIIKSILLYNIGLASRQKMVIIPLLFFLIYFLNAQYKQNRTKEC